MNYEIAANILAEIKPARRKRERYRQRDEMQHRVIPLLPADDRDKFERARINISGFKPMNGKDKNHERQNHSDHPCPCEYVLRI